MKKFLKEQGAPPPTTRTAQGAPPPTRSGSGRTGQQTPTTTSTIPEFLKNVDGVKKFQDWLDQTHPGWATGYPNGILDNAGGYGKFGPRTKAAWNSNKGEEYKKSGAATLSTPETGTGVGQSEDEKWIDDKIAKGFFTGGIKEKLKSGDIVYRKPAKSIKGDSEPVGVGFYYFLKGDKLPFPWRKYALVDGDYIEVDRGTYKFSDITPEVPELKKESLSEQIIVSREKEPAQTTGTAAATPTQTASPTTTQPKENYKKYFNWLGINDEPDTGKPDESTLIKINKSILKALKEGYQSNYFEYFKKGVNLLKERYPNEYKKLNNDELEIKTLVDTSYFINYPDNEIDQLSNPMVEEESFKKVKLYDLIPSLSSIGSNVYAYIWPSVVSGLDTEKISTEIADIEEQKCITSLREWYQNFTYQNQIDNRNTERVKKFLMACNNQCKYTNKDEAFLNRMFKTKQEKSAARMIEDLKSPNAGIYRINFRDVSETCKSFGKETRIEGKSTTNLKKMIRENLITEKTKKERLLKESKIIKNRLYVLVENSNKLKTQADYNKLFSSLISEANFLREQGFSEKLIQESWFSFLGKLGFGGIADALQERLMEWVLETLKIPKTSYLANLLIVGFANFDLNNISKILSGDCNTLVKFIAETIVEAFARKKMSSSGETSYLEDILRNAISDMLFKDKSELIRIVEDKLLDFICPRLSKVSTNLSGVTDKLKQSLMGS